MANTQNMTAEEFTNSVAEAIAAQLKIDANALVTRLVESLSKGLIKEFTKKNPVLSEKSKKTETSTQTTQEPTKQTKTEIVLPKILEKQFGKIDDISKTLDKIIDKTATVSKEYQFPGVLKKLLESRAVSEPSSLNPTKLLEKFVGTFKNPLDNTSSIVKETLKKFKDSLTDPFKGSSLFIKEALKKFKDSLTNPFAGSSESIKESLKKFKDGLKNPFEGSYTFVKETLKRFSNSLTNPFAGSSESIKESLKKFKDGLKNPFEGSSESIKETLKKFKDGLTDPFKGSYAFVKDTLKRFKDSLTNPFAGSAESIKETLKKFKDGLSNPFTGMKNPFEGSSKLINDTLNGFRRSLKNPFDGIENPFKGSSKLISDTIESFKRTLKNPFEGMKNPFEGTSKTVKDALDGFKRTLKNPFEGMKNPFEGSSIIVRDALESFRKSLKNPFAGSSKIIGDTLDTFKKTLKSPFEGMKNPFEGYATTIKDSLQRFTSKLKVSSESKDKEEKPAEKSTLGVFGSSFQKFLDSLKKPEQVKVESSDAAAKAKEKPAEPKSLLAEQKEEPKPVVIAGITENGLKNLQDYLPDIIKAGVADLIGSLGEKEDKKKKLEFPSMGVIGGALGVISTLGGIFTLLYGLQTDGPFKGLAKLAGLGMLKVGEVLTRSLRGFIGNVVSTLIEFPIKLVKSFGGSAIEKISDIAGALSKVGSNKLVAPIVNFVKGIGAKIIEVPMKLISSFGASISGLFGKVGGTAALSGIGKVGGFVAKFLGGFAKMFAKVPIIGSLISIAFAVSRFKSGDYVGGGIETLSALTGLLYATPLAPLAFPISLALNALNAFLDFKAGGIGEGKQGKGSMMLGWVGSMIKWVGKKIYDVITLLPVVGPAIKAVKEFGTGNFLKGLKQLAYINPVFEALGGLLGDSEAGSLVGKTGGVVGGAIGKVAGWFGDLASWVGKQLYKAITFIPIIGPALKSVEALSNKDWTEAIKQFAYINPMFQLLGAMIGDENVSGAIKATTGAISGAVDWVSGIGSWIGEKILNLPIIGPAIKAVQALFDGNFPEALKQFVHINPLVGLLEQFFQTDAGKDVSAKASGGLSQAVDFFAGIKDSILSKVLEFIPETVWGYPLRAKVAEILGIGPKAEVSKDKPKVTTPSEPAPPIKQVGDAQVNPEGGLVVSSPKEGSLFQLSKKDGIVAGPVAEEDEPKSTNPLQAATRALTNIGNSDKLLTKIANNTDITNKNLANLANGFSVLAKSLESLGVSIANQTPTVINNNVSRGSGSSAKISASQMAAKGNSAISNFRAGIEASRFVPA